MPQLFANNAASTLAEDISPWHTSLTVAAGEGALFPSPDNQKGEFFLLTLASPSGELEIVEASARAGDVLTVSRGREGTSALSFAAGDKVELRLTAGGLANLVQAETLDPAAASTVKGVRYVSADPQIEDHGDATVRGSLAWTLAQVGSGRAGIVLPAANTYQVQTSLSIGNNVTLVVDQGALLQAGPGTTVTLDCAVQAGPWRIFSGEGTFEGGAGGRAVYPQWFGAKADGASDDTAALEKALGFACVHLPLGTYLVSSTLPLSPRTSLRGERPDPGYIDWTGDFEQPLPAYHGRAAVVQCAPGVHTALFTAADHVSFADMVLRCGQVRTTADRFFDGPCSHVNLTQCKFENLESLVADESLSTAFGALRIDSCKVFNCGTVSKGVVTDLVVTGSTFTSCKTCFETTSGSGFNVFTANRFEWNEHALVNYQGRSNLVSGNLFDAHEFAAIKLHHSSNNHITGNLFWRNGRDGSAAEKRSHLVLVESSAHNHIQGNTFLKGSPDDAATPEWPRYVLEVVSAAGTHNIFQGNATADGCTEMPFFDAWDNSTDALVADQVHLKGIGNPGAADDKLIEIIKRIAWLSSQPVDVHLYEDRKFTVYTDLTPGKIRLRGHGSVTLTDATGRGHSLLELANLTYGQSYGPPVSFMSAAQAPAAGTWARGAVVWNEAPSAAGVVGWICVAAGTPGTWKSFGTIAA